MKPAYVVGNITVTDHGKWIEYRNKIPETLTPWDGEILVRGKKLKVLGGEFEHELNVVISFPSIEAANGWFSSDKYQELIPLREQAAKVDLISYEKE